MLGEVSAQHDIVWAAALTSAASVIVGVLILAGVIYQSNKTRSKLDTGNGKDIGYTVHDMAQTQEILQAQSHTNSKELLDVVSKLDVHLEEARLDREELHGVKEKLTTHLDVVEPLLQEVHPALRWVTEKMEGEQNG